MATCGLKVREAGEGQEQSRTVVGTPIVFGVRSHNLTPWSSYREVYEVMEPGCISDELLRESDVVLNLNHSNKVTDILGRWRNGEGTLKLQKNLRDIGCECDIAETSAGNDTLVLIKRGDITGMSFAFDDDYEDSENGVSYERMKNEDHDGKEVWVRHVKRVTGLYDVTIAGHPAYQQTDISQREATDKALDAIIGEPAGLVAKREAEKAAQDELDRQKAELQQREAELKEQQMKQEMQRRAAHLKKLSSFDQTLEESIY